MSGFTKLVPEIIQSSIWNEPPEIRIVWITMLAIKDQEGYVRGDSRTIARMANVTLETAEIALKKFQEPDPYSHSPEFEGRRIAPKDGGYVVLNHAKYRARDFQAEHREHTRRWRERKNLELGDSHVTHPSVSVSVSSPEGMQGEIALNGKKRTERDDKRGPPTHEQAAGYAKEIGFAGWEAWYDHFESNGWKVANKTPMKDWRAAMRNGKRWAQEHKSVSAPRQVIL